MRQTGSACERALLSAGFDEVPDDRCVRAAALALGVAPTAATSLDGVQRFGVSTSKWLTLTTHVAAPIVAVAAIVVALHGVAHREAIAPRASNPAPSVEATSDGISTMPDPAPVVAPSDRLPVATQRGSHRALATAGEVPRRRPDTYGAQVELIDRARALASAKDSAGALRALDEYDRRFPSGLLSEEASLLRIEEIAARGDRETASSLARRFLAEYPRSVHAERLQPLLGKRSL